MSDRVVRRVNGPQNCPQKELRELGGTVSLQDPENEGKKKKKNLPALPTGGILYADFQGNGHPVLSPVHEKSPTILFFK